MISSEEIRLGKYEEALQIAEMSRIYIEYGLGWSCIIREIKSQRSNVVVAVEGEKVIGFAIMCYGDQDARLNLFAVDPAHRRKGIGTRLIQWLEKTALVNGNGIVYLEARSSNRSAIKFYEHLGYQVVQEIPGYYQGKESAVRLAHDLWAETSR